MSSTTSERSMTDDGREPILWLAAACSLAAGAVHSAMLGSHWDEYWGYGLFFALAASFQLAWAMAAAIRPDRLALPLGIAGNIGITAMWAITRTSGIPFGPASGETEGIGLADLLTVILQMGIIVLVSGWLLGAGRRPIWPAVTGAALLVAVGVLPVVTTAVLVDASGGGDSHGAAEGEEEPTGQAGAGQLRVVQAYAPETLGNTAAVYFVVENAGEADRLISAKATVGSSADLHETVVEGATSRMQALPQGLVVPEHGELVLRPGLYHLMLTGVAEPLDPGDVIEVTLIFERAGQITLDVPVRPLLSSNGDHSDDGDGHE